jgi:hypothetical protein
MALEDLMRAKRWIAGVLLFLAGVFFVPQPATAQEVSFVMGALIGDSFRDVLGIVDLPSIAQDFKNAPLFGGRVGVSAFPFAVEGSVVYSPSAVNLTGGSSFDAKLIYAEADLQIVIFPGPVQPYVGGGIGLHHIRLQTGTNPNETVLGYVLGGGLKLAFGSLGARIDLKDHITPLKVDSVSPEFREALFLVTDQTLHNIELSGGITIRF